MLELLSCYRNGSAGRQSFSMPQHMLTSEQWFLGDTPCCWYSAVHTVTLQCKSHIKLFECMCSAGKCFWLRPGADGEVAYAFV
jgi:hypothetical protein